jgi:NRPS condensation-like uncharacterized protein
VDRIPQRIPAEVVDQFVYGLKTVTVPLIHLTVDFEAPVDRGRLVRALRLLLDAEPVLGCRFVPRPIRPYFDRVSAGELDRLELLRESDGGLVQGRHPVESFLAEEPDLGAEPQLKALILPRNGGERLVLKISHLVADGGGSKEIGYRLASIYRQLEDRPKLKVVPNHGSRGILQVCRHLPASSVARLLWRSVTDSVSVRRPYRSLRYPMSRLDARPMSFEVRRFSGARFAALDSFRRRTRATINDLLVTAMLRAWVRMLGEDAPGAYRLLVTVDLRRYIPGRVGAAPANLSSFLIIDLGRDLGRSFTETLARAKTLLDAAKADLPGLPFMLGSLAAALPMPFFLLPTLGWLVMTGGAVTGNQPPALTNAGLIDRRKLDFGGPAVANAELTVPASLSPHVVTCASGFGGSATLSVGFQEAAVPRRVFADLFELMDQELPG